MSSMLVTWVHHNMMTPPIDEQPRPIQGWFIVVSPYKVAQALSGGDEMFLFFSGLFCLDCHVGYWTLLEYVMTVSHVHVSYGACTI